MARKKDLVFNTKKRKSNGSLYKFTVILIASALTVLSGSLIFLYLEAKDNETGLAGVLFGDKKEEVTQAEENVTAPVLPEAERTFLLMCADGDRQKIHFMNLIKVEVPENRVTVLTVNPDAIIRSSQSGGESAEMIYAKSGERVLTLALEEAYGIKIDRYASATPMQFKSTVNFFGGIKINVPEQVNYKADGINLVLIKGTKTLNGDEFYKYMLYLNDKADDGSRKQAKVMLEILGSVFTPANIEKKDRIFSQITNNFTTNITVVDMRQEEAAVLLLMQEGIKKTEIAAYPQEFSDDGGQGEAYEKNS